MSMSFPQCIIRTGETIEELTSSFKEENEENTQSMPAQDNGQMHKHLGRAQRK